MMSCQHYLVMVADPIALQIGFRYDAKTLGNFSEYTSYPFAERAICQRMGRQGAGEVD